LQENNPNLEAEWPLRLFNKSVLKQRKFREITGMLGPTDGLDCLDIGSDNGVVSYLLRQRGGNWSSADLNTETVEAIRLLVGTNVYQIDGLSTPFADDSFDRIAVVDFLEHIPDEEAFIQEMFRILKPDGVLILNVPHLKPGLLRRLRYAFGQTDEKHGHLRPGYTLQGLKTLLPNSEYRVEEHHTYSRFFSELMDTLIVFAVSRLQKRKQPSQKGLVVTGADLMKQASMFRAFSLIYPLVWAVSKLDGLLFFTSGYMLVMKARAQKVVAHHLGTNGRRKDMSVVRSR